MKKIPSLFKRDYEGTRLVYDEVVEGSEWVVDGEGIPTVKWDGTACMVQGGRLYKRYDRKLNKKKTAYRDAPEGWMAAEDEPNEHAGHWPGWVEVTGEDPADKWHSLAWVSGANAVLEDGTYELIGPHVQSNPHDESEDIFVRHGEVALKGVPKTFNGIKDYLTNRVRDIEGIVWHHPDGRMVKIKRKDFGLPWPSNA